MKTANQESGVVLVAVVCLAAVVTVLAIGLLSESSTQLKLANRQTTMEQAFYIAEGGAERAVAYIRNGGVVPTNLVGTIGKGTYSAHLLATPDTTGTGGTHIVSGQININPNNSPQNEFLLMTTDGQSYDRDDLKNSSLQDYTGNASLVRVKPKGNSDQTITVDGVAYTLERNTAYNFVGDSFPIVLTNDSRGTNGLAMGQWWININGSGISFGDDPDPEGEQIVLFSIYSSGTVEGSKRMVFLDGVHQTSWAKYALWYDSGPGEIWILGGEQFDGPVHANTYIYLKEDPIFNALVSSTRSSWGENSNTKKVEFNAGYLLNAPAQSMASINFSNLMSYADMIITGTTAITLSGTNMLISNSRAGWANSLVVLPSNGLIYVKNATNTPDLTTTGTVSVAGTLDGRLSIACDYDIKITNHITYANTNIALGATNISDDALGLIAKHDVIVMTNAPNNLNIYAHIIAEGSATTNLPMTDGSFYVQNSSGRPSSGKLNVYGGIAQYYRGAVGTVGGKGFLKHYIFDQRFTDNPPPQYPAVTDEYQWQGWRDK